MTRRFTRRGIRRALPYIKHYAGDEELYQTVYSRRESSAAAPTAGLHFTPELIERLREKGIDWETVELEVGLDTFRIVDEEDPLAHKMHTEFYTVPQKTVDAINRTHANGGRVVAVGTTSVRSLESAWIRRPTTAPAPSPRATAMPPAYICCRAARSTWWTPWSRTFMCRAARS